MPEQSVPSPSDVQASQAAQPAQAAVEASAVPAREQPPWAGEPFDPERAWSLIQGLRGDKTSQSEKITALEGKVKAFEDAQLTEQERAAKTLAEVERTARDAAREAMVLREAMAAGLTSDHLPFISGDSPEQVKDNITKLLGLLQATPHGAAAGRPRETPLRAGTDPTVPAAEGDWLREALDNKQ